MKKELGRNDPCHCGSGKKYKNCHMGKASSGGINNNKNLLYIAIMVVIVAIAGFSIYFNSQTGPTPNNVNSQSGPVAQPPGEAPAGKVWSSAHGHWHDK